MEALRVAAIVISGALVLGLLLFACAWVWATLQPLPSTRARLPPRRDKADREALLTYPAWRKRGARALDATRYERPPDILDEPAALPDDAVLPPPRPIAGRNGEA